MILVTGGTGFIGANFVIDWPIPLGKQTLLNAKDTAGLAWDTAPKF